MKKTFYIILGTVITVLLIIVITSYFMLQMAVKPQPDRRHDIQGCYDEVYASYPDMRTWHDSLVALNRWRDTTIMAEDGLRRHAIVLQHPGQASGATVMLHGHNDNAVRMMRYAYLHYEMLNRDVVLPDHFGHGESEGDHVRFAWLDRKDVSTIWIPATHHLWPDLPIIVHGLSMGGAMTMYTAGEDIPDEMNVVAYIEDCGYSSIYEQLAYQLDAFYGLPGFPLLNCADWLCYMLYGWSLNDGDTSVPLSHCQLPMLFIHGDADTYVPTSMLMQNYEAKTQGYKELWITPGSDHAESIHDHWEEYITRCQDFISRVNAMR